MRQPDSGRRVVHEQSEISAPSVARETGSDGQRAGMRFSEQPGGVRARALLPDGEPELPSSRPV